MKYTVLLHETEEGFDVSVSGLPGCLAQGYTEEEALENIKDAIKEYLAAKEELRSRKIKAANAVSREIEIAV